MGLNSLSSTCLRSLNFTGSLMSTYRWTWIHERRRGQLHTVGQGLSVWSLLFFPNPSSIFQINTIINMYNITFSFFSMAIMWILIGLDNENHNVLISLNAIEILESLTNSNYTSPHYILVVTYGHGTPQLSYLPLDCLQIKLDKTSF